ncbi:MAG: transposase [Rhodobacterales bacterium]|nr:MAG: transposase [Rhodobacterales bacterium]
MGRALIADGGKIPGQIKKNGQNGRCLDNILIGRLWRSIKYEYVYLHAWETGSQPRAGIGRWITFYSHHRPHSAHGGQPPAAVYFIVAQIDQQVQAVALSS